MHGTLINLRLFFRIRFIIAILTVLKEKFLAVFRTEAARKELAGLVVRMADLADSGYRRSGCNEINGVSIFFYQGTCQRSYGVFRVLKLRARIAGQQNAAASSHLFIILNGFHTAYPFLKQIGRIRRVFRLLPVLRLHALKQHDFVPGSRHLQSQFPTLIQDFFG